MGLNARSSGNGIERNLETESEFTMSNYIIAYRGGSKPATPEEGAAQMQKWKAWVADLGASAVNPGTPLSGTRIVSSTSVSEEMDQSVLSGFSVVEAASMDDALVMAQKCPFLDTGGTLQVSEMMQM
jgi:hypothetical protein